MKTLSYKPGKILVNDRGDSIKSILSYWLPEVITATVLYSLSPMLDGYFVAQLGSLATFGALGVTNSIIHLLIKLAEGIPAASIALIGKYNGAQEYEECGTSFGTTFWATFIIGFSQLIIIMLGAEYIFQWMGVPDAMIPIGTPFLRLKSLGIFLLFSSLALVSFMKAVKNTHIPMIINLIGITAFIFFDYSLILGKMGFTKYGLLGSAIASVIQYGIMNAVAITYILSNSEYKKYFKKTFFRLFSLERTKQLLHLSWPIIIDKGTMAIGYVWLNKMITPMGMAAIGSYEAIQRLERLAFIPAIAFAQIIVFLVSNRIGSSDYQGAFANVKKTWFLGAFFTTLSLLTLSTYAEYFVSFYDTTNEFSHIAVPALQLVSLFVVFDLTQVILAGALRGAHDVKTVMLGRAASIFLFFIPVSYFISQSAFTQLATKLIVIYGTLYLTTGIMGIIFLWRIKGRAWYHISR